MKAKGYSLIEYCVYLLCCTVVALIVSWCILDFLNISQKRFHHSPLYYCGALNLLGNDLLYAPQNRQNWHVVTQNTLIWKNHTHDVGWHVCKNNLWRITGEYDKKSESWKKHSKNLVAYHIENFNAQLIMKKRQVIGVKVTMSNTESSLTFYFPTMHGKQCFIS
jgi:hypothetical protein